MKLNFARIPLLFLATLLLLITCKAPVNKKIPTSKDNSWIEELTVAQLQQGYKEGKYTVKDIVQVYLDRINELDKNGPRLNSIIVINPDAMTIADEMDKELAAGKTRGPMHGWYR